jgi:hypothetical protein
MNNDAECAVGFENDGQSRSIQPPIAAATLLHGQGETIAFIRISAALAYTSTAVDMNLRPNHTLIVWWSAAIHNLCIVRFAVQLVKPNPYPHSRS